MSLLEECKEIRHIFWEFYALNHLWFMIGDGKKEYGYQTDTVYNSRIIKIVNERFESVTDLFFDRLLTALEESIRSEMLYVFSPNGGDFKAASGLSNRQSLSVKKRELDSFLKQYDNKITRDMDASEAPITWAKYAFAWKGWASDYCGPLWAHACEVFLEAEKFKTLKAKISWIDNVLDLYHNNGYILDKTYTGVLFTRNLIGEKDLDMRYRLRNWPDEIKDNKITGYDFIISGKFIDFEQRRIPLSSKTLNLIHHYKNKI